MHKGTSKVLGIDNLTPNTFSLRIERKGLEFLAGQCVNLGIPNTGLNREYSTYSGENEEDLRFLIREVENGQVTPALKNLKPGDFVEVDGAYGLFTLREPQKKDVFYNFIATGTGIAPFHCFVKSYPHLDYKVIHGIRREEEAYNREDYKNYVSCTSRENKGDFNGRVTDYLKANPVDSASVCYLCGNRNMINECYDILRDQGVSGSNIITEVFF